MSLPPQLIGIKRRRQDGPVDVLYLEEDRSSNKRRFTDFVFQRLKPTGPELPFPHAQPGYKPQKQERFRSVSGHTIGAPLVQSTSPGAEVRDALQRRAVRAQLLERQKRNFSSESDSPDALIQNDGGHEVDGELSRAKRAVAARRFHLSRTNFTQASSKHSGGIRKHKHPNRSHLATFVETHVDRLGGGKLHVFNKTSAVDRLINDSSFSPQVPSGEYDPPLDQAAKDTPATADYSPQEIQSFIKGSTKLVKTGNSINDHPSTWDQDSDQLANELAAFALEIDKRDHAGEGDTQHVGMQGRRSPKTLDNEMEVDNMYVYETYLRVPRNELSSGYDEKIDSIGMLVIEEQDEELWQTFAEDDEDSEWDEEDGDSNAEDNPRNDYPEDEVSSEDEYDHGAYNHRHAASDDEEYDLEDPPSSDDESTSL